MSIHIIIDGYNLIRQSKTLSLLDSQDIQLGREALIDQTAEYQRLKKHRVSIVFDGQNAPPVATPRDRINGIEILFSPLGVSADTLIKRMAAREREQALIVTSDREIQAYVLACGADVVDSPVFEEKLMMAGYSMTIGEDEDSQGWIPTTQKKGPRRRLPRRARKNRLRIQKL